MIVLTADMCVWFMAVHYQFLSVSASEYCHSRYCFYGFRPDTNKG